MRIADIIQLAATSFDSGNNKLTGHSYSWKSADTGIASVTPGTGIVTAITAGTAIITVLDKTNNASAQIPINVKSLAGNWIAPLANTSSTCNGTSLCSLSFTESQTGAGNIATNYCTDSCNNVLTFTETFQRTGATVSATGTVTYKTSGGTTTSYPKASCLYIWDGTNVLNQACAVTGFGVLTSVLMRNEAAPK
jgi:hypothetical protein